MFWSKSLIRFSLEEVTFSKFKFLYKFIFTLKYQVYFCLLSIIFLFLKKDEHYLVSVSYVSAKLGTMLSFLGYIYSPFYQHLKRDTSDVF